MELNRAVAENIKRIRKSKKTEPGADGGAVRGIPQHAQPD